MRSLLKNNKNPYISFVMAARNDNFGGNFLQRLQLCVNSILILSNKYDLDMELIIVEWNPPDDHPRLKDAIIWPENQNKKTIKIIEVPNEVHKRYKNSEKIPFFEFLAKNIGIRRAKGKYILITNSDVIFSDEIIKYFSLHRFSENAFFRADRHDVNKPLPKNLPIEKQIEFCENNFFQIQTMYGALIPKLSDRIKINFVNRIKRINLRKIINKIKNFINSSNTENQIIKKSRNWNFKGLHINVGGDFMMMSKKQWEYFKGYPEIGIDRGLDCYMTIMAHIGGLLQVILPYPIYHPEHDRTTQYLRPTAVLENIPVFKKMIETQKVMIDNNDDWGLKNTHLKETII